MTGNCGWTKIASTLFFGKPAKMVLKWREVAFSSRRGKQNCVTPEFLSERHGHFVVRRKLLTMMTLRGSTTFRMQNRHFPCFSGVLHDTVYGAPMCAVSSPCPIYFNLLDCQTVQVISVHTSNSHQTRFCLVGLVTAQCESPSPLTRFRNHLTYLHSVCI